MTRPLAAAGAGAAALALIAALWWAPWRADGGPSPWIGYVEGEFLDIGAQETARLVELPYARGDAVSAGATLFRLDDADAAAARDEAAERLRVARAEYDDLLTGGRPEEIAAIEAQRVAAAAALEAARLTLDRQSELVRTRASPVAALDEARERHDVAKANLEEAEARLAAARLPARPARIEAASRAVDAAAAALTRAGARLERLHAQAPADARVEDVYYRVGETVPAGRAVVRLLPVNALKVRFFVPQDTLARIAPGMMVSVDCDGCPQRVDARIAFIAAESEFTPPVIFSASAREKLVYLVEAALPAPDGLRPGQPVDVRPAPVQEAGR